jgi:asparagine synthase (glutamine-hydrolysing)
MNTHAELDWETPSNAQGAEVLHWDGRLDNRDDLLLLLRDRLREDNSNAALACAAFERYGPEGFVRLIGDWSMVIRDRSNRAIVLASDFVGVRPLYYCVRPDRVFWSSRLQSILAATGATELDEHYIRGFLLLGGCPNRTPYKDIHPVPSGHAVILSSEGTKIRRFWNLPIGDEIRYRTERQYEEHLRALFREAVAVRLQKETPVLAELSGGLDSSSVVSMATHLMQNNVAKASRLTGVSYVWRDSLDEPFIREVESFCGIDGIHISTHEIPLASETQVGQAAPEIFQPVRLAIAATARRLGATAILTGQIGDLTMGNWFDDSLQVAAALRRGRIGRGWRESLAWSKSLRLPVYTVLWKAFRAALPPTLAPVTLYIAPDGSCMPRNSETSLSPTLCGGTTSSAPEAFFSNTWMQASPERRKHFWCLSMMLELRALQAPEALQHLEYTHPFAHRPLVEFLMAVPVDVLCRPDEPRRLMRSALSDLWPPKLQRRRSKGLFNAPWQEALKPLARVLLKEKRLHLVECGFVDRASFLSRLERLSGGLDCNVAQLREIIVLEFWLRQRADASLWRQALQAA